MIKYILIIQYIMTLLQYIILIEYIKQCHHLTSNIPRFLGANLTSETEVLLSTKVCLETNWLWISPDADTLTTNIPDIIYITSIYIVYYINIIILYITSLYIICYITIYYILHHYILYVTTVYIIVL